LTPSYLFEDDAAEFHSFWKGVCDKYHPDIYPEQKAWCDK
jgi:coproporphyrinogen III oxidase